MERWKISEERENIPISKSSDARGYFYVVMPMDFEITEATGDGTDYEAKSRTILVSVEDYGRLLQEPNTDMFFHFGHELVMQALKKLDNDGRLKDAALITDEEVESILSGAMFDETGGVWDLPREARYYNPIVLGGVIYRYKQRQDTQKD